MIGTILQVLGLLLVLYVLVGVYHAIVLYIYGKKNGRTKNMNFKAKVYFFIFVIRVWPIGYKRN